MVTRSHEINLSPETINTIAHALRVARDAFAAQAKAQNDMAEDALKLPYPEAASGFYWVGAQFTLQASDTAHALAIFDGME